MYPALLSIPQLYIPSPSSTESSTVWCTYTYRWSLLLASTSLALFDLVFLDSCLFFLALFLSLSSLLRPSSDPLNQSWFFFCLVYTLSLLAASNAALLKAYQHSEMLISLPCFATVSSFFTSSCFRTFSLRSLSTLRFLGGLVTVFMIFFLYVNIILEHTMWWSAALSVPLTALVSSMSL